MCTRFYILPGSPDLEYIVKTAEKSPLLRRFVHNRMSKIMPGNNPDKRDRMIAQQLSFTDSDFGGSSAASSAQNNADADKAGSTSEILSISGEIRPTDIVPVLAPDKNGNAAVYPMEWGFRLPAESGNAETPHSLQKSGQNPGRNSGRRFGPSAKGKLLVNARSETAAVKASFREAWACRRCIIPASWYYEWEHLTGNSGQKRVGDKYMIQPKGSSMTWLAGLYRIEDGLPVFAVLTKEPTEDLRRIHDRMPLILPEDRIDEWINPLTNPKDILRYSIIDMVMEKAV